MTKTQIKEFMTQNPKFIKADATLKEAAEEMKKNDCGVLPVGTKDNVEGVITDRDIVIRAIAQGKNPATEKVSQCMTKQVCSCNESDSLQHAADQMNKNKVSRIIVKNKDNEITGVLSFGHILRNEADMEELMNVVKQAVGEEAA